MLEKTLSTFHTSNVLLQQQYREQRFSKYSELISCLLFAEQNSIVLLKNHNSRPTGSLAVPEANVSLSLNNDRGRGNGRHKSSSRGGRNNSSRRGGFKGPPLKFKNHQKWSAPQHKNNQNPPANHSHRPNDTCHRCGRSEHWSRTCRVPKKVVEQYKHTMLLFIQQRQRQMIWKAGIGT